MARSISSTAIISKNPATTERRGKFVKQCCCLAACLLGIAATPTLCWTRETIKMPAQPMSVVTILTEDNQGAPLRFPSVIAFDREQEETYVITGGHGGIVIYDSDFIPYLFIGAGRGIESPQCVFFEPQEGNLYICQTKWVDRPPRLTILNGAFFPIKDIFFDHIPDAENFSPHRGVLGKTGNIYLVDNNIPGVLVLDRDGNFLRWLKPMDTTIRQMREDKTVEGKDSRGEKLSIPPLPTSGSPTETDILDLPAELRPKSRLKAENPGDVATQEPVTITDIIMDSEGHLFLLSEETSKVYVYTADEKFLFSFGEKGGSTGKMSRPRGIAIDEDKKVIYIVDYMRHTILTYDLSGKYLFEFGGLGIDPLWFNFPNSIAIDRKGRLIVADMFNNRIQFLKGDFTTTFSDTKKQTNAPSTVVTPKESSAATPTTLTPKAEKNPTTPEQR